MARLFLTISFCKVASGKVQGPLAEDAVRLRKIDHHPGDDELNKVLPGAGELCWLLGTSVRKIHAFLRTDVPRSQHRAGTGDLS